MPRPNWSGKLHLGDSLDDGYKEILDTETFNQSKHITHRYFVSCQNLFLQPSNQGSAANGYYGYIVIIIIDKVLGIISYGWRNCKITLTDIII